MRIAAVLGTSTDRLLRAPVNGASGATGLRDRIAAALDGLDAGSLEVAAVVIDGLVARSSAEDGS